MARPRGTGRVFTRGGSRWIAYSHRGEERRESVALALGMLPSQVKVTDAWGLLKKRLAEMESGRYVAHQDRVLFGELLDGLVVDYTNNGRRSVDTLTAHIKPVRAAFGTDRAVDVTEARVERYKDARLGAQRKPATVNRELAVIRRAFRLAVRQKRLATMPVIVLLAEHNARQGFFERGDFETLCAHLPEHLRDFARFAYLSGWRKGEVASLTWANVDRDARLVRLLPGASKNGEGRTLALEGDLWELAERRRAAREYKGADGGPVITPLVFHYRGAPVRDLRKAWATACEKANVPGRLFHDLRRTAIRNMVRAGVSQPVAMKISGHRTAAVFRRYDITTDADIRDALRRTQAHISTQPIRPSVAPLERGTGQRAGD